jgi:hypothetical protein
MDNLLKVTVNSIQEIDEDKRIMIGELTIVGRFTPYRDLPILKSMCNTIVDGQRTGGNLYFVDLSKCELYDGNWNYDDWGLIDCISLRRIIFPKTARFNNTYGKLFSGCISLESIEIEWDSNNRAFDIEGVLFVRNTGGIKRLLKFPANKGNEYTIPSDTNVIADYAFEDSHLSRLFMPAIPIPCTEKAFEGVNVAAMTLVVPKGCHDSYYTHSVYGKFRIEELDD